ncbi:MAG: ATP-binding protein [Anaerolineales bacterium]|nr:ATP-binding protein [Anaerolineales bacterium]
MPNITIPGHFSGLEKIREFVGKIAQKAGMNESDIYAIQLAVDEACSNIIEHAYGGEGLGAIECTCSIDNGSIKIILRDFGEPFEPERIPPMQKDVPLQQLKPRGAGMYLMNHLMDEVSFEFDKESGNKVTMVKYFNKE